MVLPAIRDLRRAGSAALDLCSVAAGRLDGYYEAGLQPWDRGAGLLVRAGSRCERTRADGRHGLVSATLVVARSPLCGALSDLLERAALQQRERRDTGEVERARHGTKSVRHNSRVGLQFSRVD